jgi:hypothetical protein
VWLCATLRQGVAEFDIQLHLFFCCQVRTQREEIEASLTAIGKISAEHRVEVGEQLESLRSWVSFELQAIDRRVKTFDEQLIARDSSSKDETDADLQNLILRLRECEIGLDAAIVQNKIDPSVLDRIAHLEQYFVRQSIEAFAYIERSAQVLQIQMWSDMGLEVAGHSVTQSSSTATLKFAEALKLQAAAVGLSDEVRLITDIENEALEWRARATDSVATEATGLCGAAANDTFPLATSFDQKIQQHIQHHVSLRFALWV